MSRSHPDTDGAINEVGTPQIVRANADVIATWPEGWFLVEEINSETLDVLRRMALTRAVDQRPKGSEQFEYRVTSRTRERVNELQENRDAICPCGHSGLVNHGDHYECAHDLCDREFAREELNA